MSIILDKYGNPISTKGVTNDSLVAFYGGKRYVYSINKGYYSSNSVIFRGIDLLASLGSSVPFQIYRNNELVENNKFSPAFDLEYPNPSMSLNELLYISLINYFYMGEMFVYFDNSIMYLEPLSPKYVSQRDTNKRIWNYFSPEKTLALNDDNHIYLRRFNPDDPTGRGLSVIDVIKQELDNDAQALNYNTAYFKNFGKVGGFFEDTEKTATYNDMKRLVEDFDNVHSGSDQAYKTLGLPAGIQYKELTQSMREMEYLESRRDIRDKVLQLLGIHKALVGATETANRSVTEEAIRTLWLHVLQPTLTMVEQKFNQQFFRKHFAGYEMHFDYSGISELKEGLDSVLTQAQKLQSLGYTTNEINEYFDLGMDELKDSVGNMRFVPSNLIPVDDLLMGEDKPKEVKEISVSKELEDYLYNNDNNIDKSVASYKNRYDIMARKLEKKFAGKIGKHFAKELGLVMKVILSQKNIKDNIDETVLLAEIQNEIERNKESLRKSTAPIYEEASIEADKLALAAVSTLVIGQNLSPAPKSVLVTRLNNKITNISNYTYKKIRTQIKEGIRLSESIDQIADRVRSTYKMSSSRSRIIAQTEITQVVNSSAVERYKEVGVKEKRWISIKDSSTRDSHYANDKIGPVDMGFVYPNGQEYPGDLAGGPAEVVNCRCTLYPVTTRR